MVLECDITMTASDCTGTIVCTQEAENQQVLLDGKRAIYLDGIPPQKQDGVVRYNLDISHITNRKWDSPMVPGEIMFIPQLRHGTAFGRTQAALNRTKNNLFVFPQIYEGARAYTIEGARFRDVLEEFNTQIMCGTRISNFINNVEVLQIHTEKLAEDTGTYTKYTVHNYKGVGYTLPNPSKVTIKKVGTFYFTRAEYVHRFNINGKQIDVYGCLIRPIDRRNYTKDQAEAVA